MRTELDTQHVPYDVREYNWALNRPYHERPALPRPGDMVFYRREAWDQNPVLVTVVAAADLRDRTDQNLWQPVHDPATGQLLYDNGVPRYAPVPDPWPWVRLTGRWAVGGEMAERDAITMEARLRGSPGWLPLDWRDRPVRLPDELDARYLVAPRRADGGMAHLS
jgi:hypothetical protein